MYNQPPNYPQPPVSHQPFVPNPPGLQTPQTFQPIPAAAPATLPMAQPVLPQPPAYPLHPNTLPTNPAQHAVYPAPPTPMLSQVGEPPAVAAPPIEAQVHGGSTPPPPPAAPVGSSAYDPDADPFFSPSTSAASVPASSTLREVRTSTNQPIMLKLVRQARIEVHLHYIEDNQPAYVHCAGQGCLLCHALGTPTTYMLFAAYNVKARAMEALRISMKNSPFSLRPQIGRFTRDPNFEQTVLEIVRTDKFAYSVMSYPEPEPNPLYLASRQAFLARDWAAVLGDTYPRLSVAEILAVPGLRETLKLKGIDMSAFPADDFFG